MLLRFINSAHCLVSGQCKKSLISWSNPSSSGESSTAKKFYWKSSDDEVTWVSFIPYRLPWLIFWASTFSPKDVINVYSPLTASHSIDHFNLLRVYWGALSSTSHLRRVAQTQGLKTRFLYRTFYNRTNLAAPWMEEKTAGQKVDGEEPKFHQSINYFSGFFFYFSRKQSSRKKLASYPTKCEGVFG